MTSLLTQEVVVTFGYCCSSMGGTNLKRRKKKKTVCINLDIITEFMDKNVPKGKLRKTSVPFKEFRTESEALFQFPVHTAAGRQITPAEQLKDTQYKHVECGTPDSEVKYISEENSQISWKIAGDLD